MQTAPLSRSTAAATALQPAVSGEVLSALINLAGRQRMLSQRIVLHAVLAARGHAGALAAAREALALFSTSHTSLVHGRTDMPGAHFETIQAAYFGAKQGDARIREFIALTERTLASIEDRTRSSDALLQGLIEAASPMLELLNQLTQIYEAEAARCSVQQRRRQQAMLSDIQTIAKQARIVAFNAQVCAARAGQAGREFAVVADTLTRITGEIENLVQTAVHDAAR